MDPDEEHAGTTVGALKGAMDLLEQMPPAGPRLREQGYTTEAELVDGLDDPDATVRRGCIELLGESWSARTVAAVAAKLDDPAWEVRYTAVHALRREPTAPDVLPAAITTLRRDGNRYVRMLAVELVGGAARSDSSAARALEDVRDGDADAAVRRKAGRWAPGGVNDPQGPRRPGRA